MWPYAETSRTTKNSECPIPLAAIPILHHVNILIMQSSLFHNTLGSALNQIEDLFRQIYKAWPTFNINTFYIKNGNDKRTFLNRVFIQQQDSLTLDNRFCVEWLKMFINAHARLDLNTPLLQLTSKLFSGDNSGKKWKLVRPLEMVLTSKSVFCQEERREIFNLILNHKSTDVNLLINDNHTILYVAMKHDPYYVGQLLACAKTKVNGVLGACYTPLLFAQYHILHLQETSPWFEILVTFPLKNIELLLEHKNCDVTIQDSLTGFTPILLAAMTFGCSKRIFERILEIDPTQIYAMAKDNTNLFFIGVLCDNNVLNEKIITLYVNMKFKRLMTTALCLKSFPGPTIPISLAQKNGFLTGHHSQEPSINDTMQKTIGAQDFYRNYVGATVLHLAIIRNNLPLLNILLNTDGIDVDLSIKYLDQTALELAVNLQRNDCVAIIKSKINN